MDYSSSPTIINNTIVNGHSGIYIFGSSSPTITNNIIVGNHISGIRCESSSPIISYNDLWDNGINYEGCSPGSGDISVPPFFVDDANNDYHLQKGSPCIDAGDPSSDYSNEPEPNGDRINLGPYGNTSEATTTQEIFVPDWYVDASVPSSGDGTSWETAFKTIIEGIKAARSENTVHVAAGTYHEDIIIYRDSLNLLGEDKETTIIEGGGALESPIGIRVVADNFHMRRFTVQNSMTNIKLEESQNATIADTLITGEQHNAAGIHISNNSNNNTVTGCLITNNFRGLEVYGNNNHIESNTLSGSEESGVVVGGSNNQLVDNSISSSRLYGIWLYDANNTSILNNVIDSVEFDTGIRIAGNGSNNIISSNIISNCSENGIGDASSATNVIINNLITKNGLWIDTAGIKLYSSSPIILNNTIANNFRSGIYCVSSSSPEIVNNIITANGDYGIFADSLSDPVISFNDVWGNSPNYGVIPDQTGIMGNISVGPMFVDAAGGDYHLTADSPCIDVGTNDASNLPYTDKDGNPRIMKGIVDMGAYEFNPFMNLSYAPVTPCRIVDTRLAGGAIPAGGIRSYNVWGNVASQGGNSSGCPSPKGDPYTAHINVTVVPSGNGNIVAYPFGSTAPNASLVNYRSDAQNIANSATVKTCNNCSKTSI